MDNLTALARYFNVTLDWLITGQQPASPEQSPVSQTVINNYYNAWHYEYKSQRTLFGLPLVHIHLGRGLQRAHGIIAIGNVATGSGSFRCVHRWIALHRMRQCGTAGPGLRRLWSGVLLAVSLSEYCPWDVSLSVGWP